MTDHEDRDGQPTVVTPFSTPRTFAPKPPVFAPDALLAGRFRIIRFIARGGMGEVYEAQDQVLGERVALKTIRSDVANDQRSMERFLREVHLSRSVTNPNVCRIFDVFHHDGLTFLTMELLPGETLAERLTRAGRLSPADALPLVEQMADALGAAHEAGVIHRDFKSGNVMLVPDDRRPGGDPRRRHGLRPRAQQPPRRTLRRSPDRDRGRPRHARLHGARADRGQGAHARRRHLCARDRDVRDGHGRAPVRGRHAPVGRAEKAQGGRAFPAKGGAGPAGRLGQDHPALPRAPSRGPLRVDRRGRRRAARRGRRGGSAGAPPAAAPRARAPPPRSCSPRSPDSSS